MIFSENIVKKSVSFKFHKIFKIMKFEEQIVLKVMTYEPIGGILISRYLAFHQTIIPNRDDFHCLVGVRLVVNCSGVGGNGGCTGAG